MNLAKEDACEVIRVENEVVTGFQPIPTPHTKIDLHDAHAIRREMARVYRDAREGRLATQEATRFIYILDSIRKAYECSQLQQQIESIEVLLAKRRLRA
jgi:hypothetical protein